MKIQKKISNKLSDYGGERPLTIAFLGDSVTHGCFELEPAPDGGFYCVHDNEAVYHTRFMRRFHAVFPTIPISLINAGISGGSAVTGAQRLERDVLSYKPDLTVVCFGLNDVYGGNEEEYLTGLDKIFKGLKEIDSDVIYMTPNMLCTTPRLTPIKSLYEMSEKCADIQNSGFFDQFLAKGMELAKEYGAEVCDCYGEWKKIAEYGRDTTYLLSNFINHPTREMHALFAASLFNKTVLGK